MSGVIGWLVGSGTLNDVTAKTAPLVTRGLGFHPRYLVLGGWTYAYDLPSGRRMPLQGPDTTWKLLRGPSTALVKLRGPDADHANLTGP